MQGELKAAVESFSGLKGSIEKFSSDEMRKQAERLTQRVLEVCEEYIPQKVCKEQMRLTMNT